MYLLGSGTLDSILNYPMYHGMRDFPQITCINQRSTTALVDAFTLPGPTNVTALSVTHTNMRAKFKVSSLSEFLSNCLHNRCRT
jgi:hypothetical protein